ncbi:hypothetical protein GCM10028799_55820 [Kribbella italica]
MSVADAVDGFAGLADAGVATGGRLIGPVSEVLAGGAAAGPPASVVPGALAEGDAVGAPESVAGVRELAPASAVVLPGVAPAAAGLLGVLPAPAVGLPEGLVEGLLDAAVVEPAADCVPVAADVEPLAEEVSLAELAGWSAGCGRRGV